jgi:Holliday junction resolvasome RuvABC DNA-binding subunit
VRFLLSIPGVNAYTALAVVNGGGVQHLQQLARCSVDDVIRRVHGITAVQATALVAFMQSKYRPTMASLKK